MNKQVGSKIDWVCTVPSDSIAFLTIFNSFSFSIIPNSTTVRPINALDIISADYRHKEGTSEYTTCDGLLTASTSSNPKSSVFEIEANGFDLNKIVIGKPGAQADATNGQMDTGTLAGCVSQAKAKGWSEFDFDICYLVAEF